jgi:methylmalonyl-CoA/ethylmalonyl-CoA epimerase
MDSELVFHHIGIACRDIDKTREFYLGLGYTASPIVDDPLQHVRICFLDKEGAPRLELLQPLDDQSPVARTLATAGVTPYHFCYEVRNIDEAIAALRTKRFLLVSGPVPACALCDRRIAFLYNKNNGLIELVENPA